MFDFEGDVDVVEQCMVGWYVGCVCIFFFEDQCVVVFYGYVVFVVVVIVFD